MTMAGQSEPLIPTFEGHIASTLDALVLFEACLSGTLNHVPRRPHDRERQELIKSGNVFIYEEHSSGIKRWTDGVSWSPSRILGNFLIYRELEKPFPPGEKKRALKKNKKCQQGISKPEPSPRSNSMGYPSSMDTGGVGKDAERSLIGSLIDSYPFKTDGLVKKTISVSYNGVPHHLVSYYNVNDVMAGRLQTPTKHGGLKHVMPRADLYMSQNFRAPLDEVEYNPDDRGGPALFASLAGAHEFAGHGSLQRAMSLPSFQPVQMPGYTSSNPYSFSHQPQPSGFLNPVSSSAPTLSTAAPMSYAAPSPGNYALDPSRTPRFGSSAGLGHDFPRNMPSDHSPQRRHSTFEAGVPSDITAAMSLGPIPEGRPVTNSSSYLSAPTYYLPSRPAPLPGHETFPSPRQMKPEPGLSGDDTTSQNYGLDENNADWGFEGLDGTGDHQTYFGNHATSGSHHWTTGSNNLGRT
ncbi:Global transcription regulator sge1 [Paramyrothecium foliicola]|nr:Global transcription regulator sge1 [Paramyrothecium foliicola]